MSNALILKLRRRTELSREQEMLIEAAISDALELRAGQEITERGGQPDAATVMLEGFAARCRRLANGRRQITSIQIPGDFVDLQALLLHRLDYAVVSLTPCKIGRIPFAVIRTWIREQPDIAMALWQNTVVDGAIHRQWVVAMGQHSALKHFAHLICELYVRLYSAGRASGMQMTLPLTQAALGEALGLSTIHANRTVQELRRQALITWHGPLLVINDWKRLCKLAEFDPTYLNFKSPPESISPAVPTLHDGAAYELHPISPMGQLVVTEADLFSEGRKAGGKGAQAFQA